MVGKGKSYVQVTLGQQDIFLEKHDTWYKTIQRDYRSKIWEKTLRSINSRKDKPWTIHTMEYDTETILKKLEHKAGITV